jgi:endonuclease-3
VVPAARRTHGVPIDEIRVRLQAAIPDPRCELEHEGPWQLLVATILSAQSTDARVNLVTPELFRRWPTPEALGAAAQEDVETVVKSTGFFRNKARHVREASRRIAEEHGGEVPTDLAALTALPGVARKTANLVLGTALGLPSGVVVDTHVTRVAQRLGLTRETDPVKIERDLVGLLPRAEWVDGGHRLLLHGRYVCTARGPDCGACPLNELCPAHEAGPAPEAGDWRARARAEEQRVVARAAKGSAGAAVSPARARPSRSRRGARPSPGTG